LNRWRRRVSASSFFSLLSGCPRGTVALGLLSFREVSGFSYIPNVARETRMANGDRLETTAGSSARELRRRLFRSRACARIPKLAPIWGGNRLEKREVRAPHRIHAAGPEVEGSTDTGGPPDSGTRREQPGQGAVNAHEGRARLGRGEARIWPRMAQFLFFCFSLFIFYFKFQLSKPNSKFCFEL
jgi:hypothetical protein